MVHLSVLCAAVIDLEHLVISPCARDCSNEDSEATQGAIVSLSLCSKEAALLWHRRNFRGSGLHRQEIELKRKRKFPSKSRSSIALQMTVNFSSATIFFFAFLCARAAVVATLVIPASFSAVHKTTYLQESTSIESVLKVLSSFEIDSHIEVVLIGSGFTTAIKDELQRSLKVLSDVAATTSPLKFVHEQLVYHVSSDVGLDAKLLQKLQPSTEAIEVQQIGVVLSEYHDYKANPTTIFVVHSGSLNSYAYNSVIPSCPQRTFLARKGFALLDLSARAENIRSTRDGNDHIVSDMQFGFLSPPGSQQGSNAMHTTVHDLATLIHRSGEALVPFPIFSSDMALFGDSSASSIRKALEIEDPHYTKAIHYVDEDPPVKDETLIEVVVFNICMAKGACIDDRDTSHALQNLVAGLGSNSHDVKIVAAHLSADSSPDIAHAIHAATSYKATNSPGSLKVWYVCLYILKILVLLC